MTKYISNHPFVFLISLVVIASMCVGGFLGVVRAGKAPIQATETAHLPKTDTVQADFPEIVEATATTETVTQTGTPSKVIAFPTTTATEVVAFPTLTNTPIPEKTATNQLATSIPTAEATLSLSMNPLVVHFINVGQGDSILILSPEGMIVLIDGGSASTGVVTYLRGLGVRKIDLMVATHPHEDHIGGLTQVLETMPVSRVLTNGEAYTTVAYEHFLDAISSSGAEYSEAKRGDIISLGDLTFSVLNPGGTLGDEPNENSIVLRMVYGATTFLFMGDAGKVSESIILASGMSVKADILKIGHHGSCTATSAAFVRKVQPVVGIYSAGVDNQYGFPCAAIVNTLHQYGVLVLGTNVYGGIVVTVTQDGYKIIGSTGKEIGK